MTQARDEVGKSIEAIEQSGLRVEHKDKDHDDYYEIKLEYIRNSRKERVNAVYCCTNSFLLSIYF